MGQADPRDLLLSPKPESSATPAYPAATRVNERPGLVATAELCRKTTSVSGIRSGRHGLSTYLDLLHLDVYM